MDISCPSVRTDHLRVENSPMTSRISVAVTAVALLVSGSVSGRDAPELPAAAHLINVVEQVRRIFIDAVGAGPLQFVDAIAA